jgi:hypothetical protein
VAGSVLHLVRTIGAPIAASMALLSKRGLPIEEFKNVEYTVMRTNSRLHRYITNSV